MKAIKLTVIGFSMMCGFAFGQVNTPEVQAQLDQEMMIKWTRLTIFAVGSEVADLKSGDEVYVSAGMLANAELVQLDGVDYMMVQDHAVAIVY